MKFQPDVTYILSGGLGGLGRSLAQWMIRQGAKNIVFLSRSGDQKPESRAVLDALTKEGALVCAFACDVSDPEEVKKVVAKCEKDFPPIKGCIQGAMVLKVCRTPSLLKQVINSVRMPSTRT
jgi:NAD(P)-dependent dehydrogenase (short-subunit alcohol dehydrogenase family)